MCRGERKRKQERKRERERNGQSVFLLYPASVQMSSCLLDDSPKGVSVWTDCGLYFVLCSPLSTWTNFWKKGKRGRERQFEIEINGVGTGSRTREELAQWSHLATVKSLFVPFFSVLCITKGSLWASERRVSFACAFHLSSSSICRGGGSTVIHLASVRERGVASGPASGKMSTPQPEKTNKRSYLSLCTRHIQLTACFVLLRFISCVSVTLSLSLSLFLTHSLTHSLSRFV